MSEKVRLVDPPILRASRPLRSQYKPRQKKIVTEPLGSRDDLQVHRDDDTQPRPSTRRKCRRQSTQPCDADRQIVLWARFMRNMEPRPAITMSTHRRYARWRLEIYSWATSQLQSSWPGGWVTWCKLKTAQWFGTSTWSHIVSDDNYYYEYY